MKNGELTLLNPGSIGASAEPGYGLLQIEDGTVRAECRTI